MFRLSIDGLSGHMDEYDYLFVGKTLLSGGFWPTHTYIFGWDFNWLLLAWGDTHIGGLAGARLVAAALGFSSLVAMYLFVLLVWNSKPTALIAALLLGMEAAHLHISKLATYDIISFTFLIWSLPVLILVCRAKPYQWAWTVVASALLVAAVLSKYTAILYLPLIAVLVFVFAPKQGLAGTVLIVSALTAYTLVHFEQLNVLYNIQLNSAHEKNALQLDIVLRSGRQLLLLLLTSLACLLYAVFMRRSAIPVLLALVLMSCPLLVYHLLSQNVISLQKHVVFSSLFLIPIVSWGIHQALILIRQNALKNMLFASMLLLYGSYNYHQLQIIDNSFVNVEPVVPHVQDMLASETVLSEDPYLFRYLLFDKTVQSNINETTWLDNNRDGKHEFRDVEQAIWARKFDYVFLNDQQHAKGNIKLRNMLSQRGYDAILSEPYELTTMSGNKRYGTLSLHARTDRNASLAEID